MRIKTKLLSFGASLLIAYRDVNIKVDFLELVGKTLFVIIILILLIGTFALILAYYIHKTEKIIFPKTVLFVLDLLYTPLKRTLRFLKKNEHIVDDVAVILRNRINLKCFIHVPPKMRVMILPQCMRSLKCPAKLNSKDGFYCKKCGLCDITTAYAAAEAVGTRCYTVPGGTFATRVLKNSRPEAVIGVACSKDLYEGTLAAKIVGIPSQGVQLTKTGCICTYTDMDKLIDTILLGVGDEKKEEIKKNLPVSRARKKGLIGGDEF